MWQPAETNEISNCHVLYLVWLFNKMTHFTGLNVRVSGHPCHNITKRTSFSADTKEKCAPVLYLKMSTLSVPPYWRSKASCHLSVSACSSNVPGPPVLLKTIERSQHYLYARTTGTVLKESRNGAVPLRHLPFAVFALFVLTVASKYGCK